MRLPKDKELHSVILHAAQKSFGDVEVHLFGSRAFDDKIGGDIDIAIDATLPYEEFRLKKAQFLASLIREGYHLNFDVVLFHHKDPLFRVEIQKTRLS